jgi:2-polyprenyl-3-methyl-5-hydroxy-6-metoxy-1,4-benzoquinol methylase
MSGTDRVFRTTTKVFNLSRCTDCRSVFLDPPPSESELAQYYPDEYWWTSADSRLKRAETLYRQIVLADRVQFVVNAAKAIRKEPFSVRVLDIGCGSGTLLSVLKGRGYDCLGLDVSRRAAEIAEASGLRVIVGDVGSAGLIPGTIGVAMMFHVLEHVLDPRSVLARVRGLLEPGGRLVVQVPNAGSLQARLFRDRWYGWQVPRHTINYTARSVQGLLRACGFSVRRVKHFTLRDNAQMVASSLFPALDPPARNVLSMDAGGETPMGSWSRHLVYMAAVGVSLPFAVLEAAVGAGGTVMVEASAE